MSKLTVPKGYKLVGGHTGTVVLYNVVVLHYRQGDGPKLTIVVQSNEDEYGAAQQLLAKFPGRAGRKPRATKKAR